MLHLVIGGSASGKSEYGERLVVDYYKNAVQDTKIAENEKAALYYVATMYPYDEESVKRIEKHQRLRAGKGFETIECPYHFKKTMEQAIVSDKRKTSFILLECMSNLLANEMYMEEGAVFDEESAKKEIIEPVLEVAKQVADFVIITNEIFSDGMDYGSSEKYIALLGFINKELAKHADDVTEVVCGIPVKITL